MNKKLEKAIEKEILLYLDHKGCFPCKIENAGTYDPTKKVFRAVVNPYRRKGISDIMFFWKDSVYFVEVKTPDELGYITRNWDKLNNGEVKSKERLTNQIRFLQSVRAKNQTGFFVDSIERLKILMREEKSLCPYY